MDHGTLTIAPTTSWLVQPMFDGEGPWVEGLLHFVRRAYEQVTGRSIHRPVDGAFSDLLERERARGTDEVTLLSRVLAAYADRIGLREALWMGTRQFEVPRAVRERHALALQRCLAGRRARQPSRSTLMWCVDRAEFGEHPLTVDGIAAIVAELLDEYLALAKHYTPC